MYKSIIFCTALLLTSTATRDAFSIENPKAHKHSVGIVYSGIYGHGLMYQFAAAPWRFQVVAYYSLEEYSEREYTDGVAGAGIEYDLLTIPLGHNARIRTHLLAGSYYRHEAYYDEQGSKTLSVGFALGTEIMLFSRMSLSFHVGYTYKSEKSFTATYIGANTGGGISYHF